MNRGTLLLVDIVDKEIAPIYEVRTYPNDLDGDEESNEAMHSIDEDGLFLEVMVSMLWWWKIMR